MSGNNGNSDFEAFVAASDVQVGDTNLASQREGAAADPKPRRGPPREEARGADTGAEGGAGERPEGGETGGNAGDGLGDDFDLGFIEGDDQGGDDDAGDEGGEDTGTDDGRQRETAESRNKRIKRERAEMRNENARLRERVAQLENEDLQARIKILENGGLPPQNLGGSAVDKLGAAPDPLDQAKYPLGHLDAQYIEDKIEWQADRKLAERSDAALHRQQEEQRTQAQNAERERVLKTVNEMSEKGSAIYDDFKESVVDTGMRGEWKLAQPTFEAAADPENEHGARILYNLAHNPQEAARVASMTPAQQIRYVDRKNAEIAEKIKARRIPRAGTPPQTQARGANSRVAINPATDNLDDFEKLVKQDAKRNGR